MEPEKKEEAKASLEESLGKLEKIVALLESGNLPLEESLKKFEEGVRLYKDCKAVLNRVEKKIKILSENMKEEDYPDTLD